MTTQAHKRKHAKVDSDGNDEYYAEDNPQNLKRHKLNQPLPEDLDLFRTLPTEIRNDVFSYLNWKEAVRYVHF